MSPARVTLFKYCRHSAKPFIYYFYNCLERNVTPTSAYYHLNFIVSSKTTMKQKLGSKLDFEKIKDLDKSEMFFFNRIVSFSDLILSSLSQLAKVDDQRVGLDNNKFQGGTEGFSNTR